MEHRRERGSCQRPSFVGLLSSKDTDKEMEENYFTTSGDRGKKKTASSLHIVGRLSVQLQSSGVISEFIYFYINVPSTVGPRELNIFMKYLKILF